MAPAFWRARSALDQHGCCSKSLIACCNSGRFFTVLPRFWLWRWKLRWLVSAACCSLAACSLSSGCPVYAVFVSAVCAVVSLLAWGVHSYYYFFRFVYSIRKEKQTTHAGLLGLISAIWYIKGEYLPTYLTSLLNYSLVGSFKTLRLDEPTTLMGLQSRFGDKSNQTLFPKRECSPKSPETQETCIPGVYIWRKGASSWRELSKTRACCCLRVPGEHY